MNMKQPLLAVGLLLGADSMNANAALTSFMGAGNVGLVYSSLDNITWTQDGNLFKTLYDTDNDLVNQIVSLTPIYNDTAKGERMIAAGDFNIGDGRMTWWGANAFVNYLNSIYTAVATYGDCLRPGAILMLDISKPAMNWVNCFITNWVELQIGLSLTPVTSLTSKPLCTGQVRSSRAIPMACGISLPTLATSSPAVSPISFSYGQSVPGKCPRFLYRVPCG